jgi:hypothetical protein
MIRRMIKSVSCIRGCPYYVKSGGVWVCGICGKPK